MEMASDKLLASPPTIEASDSKSIENPVAAAQMSVTVQGTFVPIPIPRMYNEAYTHMGVFGQTTFNNQSVALVAEPIYFEFLAKVNKLTNDNEDLTRKVDKLTKDNKDLTGKVDKLTKQSERLTKQSERLTRESERSKRESELQRLRFNSAETVYEIQRLLIRHIWPNVADDDEADTCVGDLNKYVLFTRDQNTPEVLASKALNLPTDNKTIGRAFKAFKVERLKVAQSSQRANRSWDDLKADLINYCELDAQVRLENQESSSDVTLEKAIYLAQADVLIDVGKKLIPAERRNFLFNKSIRKYLHPLYIVTKPMLSN